MKFTLHIQPVYGAGQRRRTRMCRRPTHLNIKQIQYKSQSTVFGEFIYTKNIYTHVHHIYTHLHRFPGSYTLVLLLIARRVPLDLRLTIIYNTGFDRQYKWPTPVQMFNTVATLQCLCERKYSILTIHGVQQHTNDATVTIGNIFALLYVRVTRFPSAVFCMWFFTVCTIMLLQYMIATVGKRKDTVILNQKLVSFIIGGMAL